MPLSEILDKIEKQVKERESVKDELYEAMRKATRFSKQAIFSVHKGHLKEAKKLLMDASKLFGKLDTVPKVYQEYIHAGIVDSAFQEYAEAHIFLELVENRRFMTPEEIAVPSTSYLLGLMDVVGELRRRALDFLKKGNVQKAVKSLETMELIHDEFMGMDEAMRAVSELRRKSDIARRIIEATRGDVTIEVRRNSLERSIRQLEKVMKAKKK